MDEVLALAKEIKNLCFKNEKYNQAKCNPLYVAEHLIDLGYSKPLPAVGVNVKFPEKKKEHPEFRGLGYASGWNSCHDAFMSIIDKMPSCELDEEEVCGIVRKKIQEHLKMTLQTLEFELNLSYEISKAITQRFRTREISEEGILRAINDFKSKENYQIPNYQFEELAKAIIGAINAR